MTTRRWVTVGLLVILLVMVLPQLVAVARYVGFGLATGDWWNDWGLPDHGVWAGLVGDVVRRMSP